MAEIIVSSTIIGNLILMWLLIWQGWSGRLQWFTVMTALAVLVDCLCYFIHGFQHALYAPVRIFVIYLMFPLLEAVCAFEAWRVGFKWLEWLMLIQVGLAIITLLAHLHGDSRTVYELEIYATYVNLAGIIVCILMFRNEANYARQA
jgi:hypothetical protein